MCRFASRLHSSAWTSQMSRSDRRQAICSRLKKSGRRTDPIGTPHVRGKAAERYPAA